MNHNDDTEEQLPWPAATQNKSLATARQLYCDCVIEFHSNGDASDQINETRIEAHRMILARASYFCGLFDRADPDRIEEKDAEGKRVYRLVYRVAAPFSCATIEFLVGCLYAPKRSCSCADPIDAVRASLFLGLPLTQTASLIESVFVQLIGDATEEPDPQALAHLGAFVRHLLASDIPPLAKRAILQRTLGMLNQDDREAIRADHAASLPPTYYKPDCAAGDSFVGADGRRWRRLRISLDNARRARRQNAGGTVAWQGLVFGARLTYNDYDYEPSFAVEVSCAPEGEILGPWPWDVDAPAGVVAVEPRSVEIRARTYHPILGSAVTTLDNGYTLIYARPSGQGGSVSEGPRSRQAPFALARSKYTVLEGNACRKTHALYLAGYDGCSLATRSLLACEIDIAVQEIDT